MITLAHRGDRRVDPLVAGPGALAAMRAAGAKPFHSLSSGVGLDVEVLRASCYCERDAVEQDGPCFKAIPMCWNPYHFQGISLYAS